MNRVLLIDVMNHLYRDWHAQKDIERVVLGMERRIEMLISVIKPVRTVLCFDSRHSVRKASNPSYKANREDRPIELDTCVLRMQETIYECCEAEGWEADDLVATISDTESLAGRQVAISSTDRDIRQCLKVGAVNQMTKWRKDETGRVELEWYTAEKFTKVHGIEPSQWPDVQALAGEPGDNVPGCPGIGLKTALAAIRDAGSLPALAENPKAIKRDKQRASFEQWYPLHGTMNLQMVTLNKRVPGIGEARTYYKFA